MSSNELIEKLFALSADYTEVQKCCNEYDTLEEFSEEPPQPNVKKVNGEAFSAEECESLAAGEYKYVSVNAINSSVDEIEKSNEDTKETSETKKAVLANYLAQPFEPDLKKPSMALRYSSIPWEPSRPSIGGKNILVAVVALVLSILFIALVAGQYKKIDAAQNEIAVATTQRAEVEQLFKEESYLQWRNFWNNKPTLQQVLYDWETVKIIWAENGYDITSEELNTVIMSKRQSNGNVYVEDVEEALFNFVMDNKTSFDKKLVKYNGTEYQVGVTKTGLVFCWIGLVIFDGTFLGLAGTNLTLFGIYIFKSVGYKKRLVYYQEYVAPYEKIKKAEDEENYEKELAEYNDKVNEMRKAYDKQEQANAEEYYAQQAELIDSYKKEYKQFLKRKQTFLDKQIELKKNIQQRYETIKSKIKSYDGLPAAYIEDVVGDNVTVRIPGKMTVSIKNSLDYTLSNRTGAKKREIDSIIDILRSGRADTLKEAINCLKADEQHRERLEAIEEAEEERNAILEEQAEEERRHQRQMERQAQRQEAFNRQQTANAERYHNEQQRQQQTMHKQQINAINAQTRATIEAQIAPLQAQLKIARREQEMAIGKSQAYSIATTKIRALESQISDLKRKL